MGTRYSAVFFAPESADLKGLNVKLQRAVDQVDKQMSTWKPESDLMRLNRARVGRWVDVRKELATVLAAAVEVGRLSDGAFDIGVGDLVTAWGFGPATGRVDGAVVAEPRVAAHLALELDLVANRVRKLAPVMLDLSGIAKGFGVDELARVLEADGVTSYLASIDGEVRAGAAKPNGSPWFVALERPEVGRRSVDGIIEITGASLATSGDYRQVRERDGIAYGHTMDPRGAAPLRGGPAAVTVRATDCMTSDAWATAFMVLGPERGTVLAQSLGLEVLFAERAQRLLVAHIDVGHVAKGQDVGEPTRAPRSIAEDMMAPSVYIPA